MDYGYLLPTRGAVMSSPDAPTLASKAGADVIGLARRAEAMGFTSVWAGDSILAKPRFDPVTTLAAVAGVTDSVGLGTAVHLPPLRHAVGIAHRTATLDQLSGGRLLFGVGVGRGDDVAAEYENLGLPFEQRGGRLDETLDVLAALWEGTPADYDGEFYRLDEASIGFSPVRTPPIYVASAGFDPDRGFPNPIRERLVKHADGWLPIGMSPETYETALGHLRGVLEQAGRDPADVDPAYYLDVVVDEPSAAVDRARRFYRRYYPELTGPSEEWVENRGALGTVDDVAGTIESYAEAGVETLVVRFPATNQREQLDRFTRILD